MRSSQIISACCGALGAAACVHDVPDRGTAAPVTTAVIADTGFTTVPDSAWVTIDGPTLIGFYPLVSNEQLERDEGLATALDDFAYHIGTAMDSLLAAGFTVQYQGGDTLWLRTGKDRARVVRSSDSATVGYVFADTSRRRVFVYGVRTYIDLVDYAREFKRTGTLVRR